MDEKDATASETETSACKSVTVELQKPSYAYSGTHCSVHAVEQQQHDNSLQAALATCCPTDWQLQLALCCTQADYEKEALLAPLASQAA